MLDFGFELIVDYKTLKYHGINSGCCRLNCIVKSILTATSYFVSYRFKCVPVLFVG